jgi:hypothetical protein
MSFHFAAISWFLSLTARCSDNVLPVFERGPLPSSVRMWQYSTLWRSVIWRKVNKDSKIRQWNSTGLYGVTAQNILFFLFSVLKESAHANTVLYLQAFFTLLIKQFSEFIFVLEFFFFISHTDSIILIFRMVFRSFNDTILLHVHPLLGNVLVNKFRQVRFLVNSLLLDNATVEEALFTVSAVTSQQWIVMTWNVCSLDPTDAPTGWLDSDHVIYGCYRSMSVPRLCRSSSYKLRKIAAEAHEKASKEATGSS